MFLQRRGCCSHTKPAQRGVTLGIALWINSAKKQLLFPHSISQNLAMSERGYIRGIIKFRGMPHQHTTYHYQHSLFKEVLNLTKGMDGGQTNAPPTTTNAHWLKWLSLILNHMRQECRESTQEQRTVPYKSDQQWSDQRQSYQQH